MAKIALCIAHEGFQQHEYRIPKRLLEDAGHSVITVSNAAGAATGKDGVTSAAVDKTLDELQMVECDAVFFIGGPGTEQLDTQESNRVLNEAMLMQKPYGAICKASRILAKAHVLTGKKATGWNKDGMLPEIYRVNEVTFLEEPVVVDGLAITAQGPQSAEAFGKAMLELLP